MNKKNELIFTSIQEKADTFRRKVQTACHEYSKKVAEASGTAKRFKDEDGYIRSRKQEFASEARRDCAAAASAFADSVRQGVKALKAELKASVNEPINPTFAANLRFIREFGIKPSRTTLEALLELNGENRLGLAALQNVLSTSNTRLRLEYSDTSSFERDIATLERLADAADHYGPDDVHHELCEVFAEETQDNGRPWSSFQIILRRGDFDSALKAVENMSARWTKSVTYRLADEQTAAIDAEERKAAELAGDEVDTTPEDKTPSARIVGDSSTDKAVNETIAQRAEAQRTATVGLAHYLR